MIEARHKSDPSGMIAVRHTRDPSGLIAGLRP